MLPVLPERGDPKGVVRCRRRMDGDEASDQASDEALLDRWRAGDARAGNALFERHFDAVYRFFVNKVRDDAAELVQRTFLGCVEARERFRGASSFRTFLFAIARHELYAHFRRLRREAPAPELSVSDIFPSPSSAFVHRREQRVLLQALRSIPLDLQLAIELHYWEQLSASEIAEVLDVPIGTAKSRLRRAKEALAEAIPALETDQRALKTTLDNLDLWAASLKDAVLVDEE